MDKVKELVIQHQDKFKFALFAGIGIAAFNCFARADFNLILYIYVYYIWNMLESRVKQSINQGNSGKREGELLFRLGIFIDS
jgi:hypothetical protein